MAGIGFQLDQMAHRDGLGGIAGAALHGAVISSGPWLLTAFAIVMLQQWTGGRMTPDGHAIVQTILIYAFSASTVIAAPLSLVATRLTSDRLFTADRDAVPGILLAALAWAAALALLAGGILFGLAVALPAGTLLCACAILVLLAQIWIAGPFLMATRRHRAILGAYAGGIAASALIIHGFDCREPASLLAAAAAGMALTLSLLVATIRGEFPTPPLWPSKWSKSIPRARHIALAGLANAMALWIDKWILWWGPGGSAAIGHLRLNPVNDQASFLGLLTMVPGLTLILITTETRFDRAFGNLLARCTGTSNRRRIEKGRRDVARTILLDLRLLVVGQAVLACLCWVLAPEILRLIGADARGIFGFRLTAIGAVFHVIVIEATIILSYYDLFGRILTVWALFVVTSAAGTLANLDLGFAGYGWGYLVGALAAASLALALVAEATSRLTYLLFVGNNPAIVGGARRWI